VLLLLARHVSRRWRGQVVVAKKAAARTSEVRLRVPRFC